MDELLQHLMAHPNLVRGVGLGTRSKEIVDREWNILAAKLNVHEVGAAKTGQRWKRYWADLKFKTKTRAKRQKAFGTGDGPTTLDELTVTDKRVLAIIENSALYDDKNTRSSTVTKVKRTEKRFKPSWVVELETRRVDAESRLADAAMITAEAARTQADSASIQAEGSSVQSEASRMQAEASCMQAEASRMQAEASSMQAEASRMQAEASRMQAEALRDHADALKKLVDILSKK